ncbi:3-hydroxyphenylacetate 6-hydroxylase [Hyphodiscus hymeniophilus]|uniref:3-hydroxyphenylacetate 6-hydroxylase n=1 Tax=Hyphodiscus hymeniophilus TaxID=353542 RepID=A0A9P7B0H1_9HELO|nr:3-hydroxyphenylacetate 6-hydroxylase [Hyphodiscus hymeniophilus]
MTEIPRLLVWPLAASVLLTAFYFLSNEVARYRARIKGLQGPSGLPIVGNLHQATEQYRIWSQKYGPVFQIQLGNVPIVVVNSASAAKNLFLTQTSALNSRPVFHVFHKILNLEVSEFIRDLLLEGKSGALPIDPSDITHRLSLNLSLTLNYGFRAESTKALQTSPLLKEVTHIETEIGKLRSTGSNYSNYIPALRVWDRVKEGLGVSPGPAYGRDIGKRRLQYNKVLLDELKDRVQEGTDNPCIQGGVLKDPEASHLTEEELISISLSMMAEGALTFRQGAETTTPTIGWGILLLAHRPTLQAQAYSSILASGIDPTQPLAPGSPQAHYMMAFTKEILRYYTPLRLALPKATSAPAVWEGTLIPKDTMVFLNSWACNRDPIVFPDPDVFLPERWLGASPQGHYSFGYGGRMCVASHVANQGLYMAFLHLVATYELLPADGVVDAAVVDPMRGIEDVRATRAGPKGVKVRFVPRAEKLFDANLEG